MRIVYLFLSLLLLGCESAGDTTSDTGNDFTTWSHYGGDPGFRHYTSLTEIDTTNVGTLEPVWTYHTGDADTANHSQIQCNPIVVDDYLIGVTPQMNLFAVNAATGTEAWVFNPQDGSLDAQGSVYKHIMINSRGIASWTDSLGTTRIFFTAGSRTYAVDATTGEKIETFGQSGFIDLHQGLGRNVDDHFVVSTSPGMVFEDLLIMGTRVDESLPSAPGHIRAYDVRTGEQRWIFRTIPGPMDEGYDTWGNKAAWQYTGGANVWSGFSLDPERGMVFCGTGSAAYDFYGANRSGDNLFANCVLALDARTGERKWHFQTIHHDLWDKDHPTPPVLVTINKDGEAIDAVVQATKNGMLFVFERETGAPVFPIEEVPVPTEDALPGETPSPTQPIPTLPKPFARQTVTKEDINPYLSEEDRAKVLADMERASMGNTYLPPNEDPLVLLPGFDGGAEWGGPAFDPATGLLYVNANNMAWYIEMRKNEWSVPKQENWAQAGERLYGKYCQSCHGSDRAGTGNNPTLVNIGERYDRQSFGALLQAGRRMMPAFSYLKEEETSALASYILEMKEEGKRKFSIRPLSPEEDPYYMAYKLKGYTKFLAPDGKPAISPPWGTLTAIDLNSGEHRWQVPLGEYPDYKARGIPPTGTENYGGPVVTAGGLLFIAATSDAKFRAFNKLTGELLWETDLPAAGFATPSVYEYQGKQYVVIACGGGKLNTMAGDAYVAFGLPDPANNPSR
jgi:quinoprotein glucose dehydrogenase